MKASYSIARLFRTVCLFLFAFSTFAIVSCEDEIDLNLDDPAPILVVEGEVSNLDSHFVKLSYSSNYFENGEPDYTIEQNALVVLEENGTAVDTFQYNSTTRQFESTYTTAFSNDYNISIRTIDGTQYRSLSEPLEQVASIDSIYYEFSDDLPFDLEGFEVKLQTLEPDPVGDFYWWRVYVNDFYLATSGDLTYASDEIVSNDTLNFTVYFMSTDDYEDFQEIFSELTVRVEQIKISKAYYNFILLLDEQTSSGGLFDTPPAQVQGNIVNVTEDEPAIGYFRVVGIDTASIMLPEEL